MRVSGWPWTFVVLALLTATGCGSATPVAPAPQPTPAPSLTPPPVPEATPTPTPAPSPSTAPESCDGCEAPVTNTKPPTRLTLRLYTVEDGFGRFISRPDPLDPIPVGWYARIDVTAKDEFDDETNGERPPTFNWTNGFLVDVGGGHSHQRRMKVLGTGSADFWVRQQGVESNRLTLHFGQ